MTEIKQSKHPAIEICTDGSKDKTSVQRNLEIRIKIPYPQNQVKFIQQSADKLHDFHFLIHL